jgi:hypothetical protein
VIMTMTERKDPDTYGVEMTVRNTPPLDPFTIDWNYPLMVRDGFADPMQLKGAKKGREDRYSEEEFYEMLSEKPLSYSEWQKTAELQLGMPKRSFDNYRNRLTKRNMVVYKDGLYSQLVLVPEEFVPCAKSL